MARPRLSGGGREPAEDGDLTDGRACRSRAVRRPDRMARIGRAMPAGESAAVAPWSGSGWNRWQVRRPITVTSRRHARKAPRAGGRREAPHDDDARALGGIQRQAVRSSAR